MKRFAWLVPALALAACQSDTGGSATYSANHVPRATPPPPSGYSTSRPSTPYTPPPTATAPRTAPAYTPSPSAPTYTPPPAYTPPPTTYPAPTPATPAPAAPYASPPPAPAYTAPMAPRPAPAAPSGFAWARTLDEAVAQARATGRLVFIETGRDACGNCQKLKNTVVPEVSGELGAMAVGYYDDCDRDQGSKAFWLLRQKLPNAVTLPLVGWFTPDLNWVHGYSGGADANRFRQEMAKARAAR